MKTLTILLIILSSCKPTYILTGVDVQTGKPETVYTKTDAEWLCDTVVTEDGMIFKINKIEKR